MTKLERLIEIERLADIINNFFGCDAAYFNVNPFDLATYLIANGVKVDNQNIHYNIMDKSELKMENILKRIQDDEKRGKVYEIGEWI